MHNSVVIDTASGRALIGSTLVPVREAGTHGELQVGGASGPVLRPLTFGERMRLVTRAAASPAALDSLCAGVLQASMVQSGHADRRVQEILALTLAGADQNAPTFAETALRVARATGWEFRQLYDAEAAEVDRLAIYLGGSPPDSGWRRIVFARGGETLEAIRQELGGQLLQRADPFGETMAVERMAVPVSSPPTQQVANRLDVERVHPSGGQATEHLAGPGALTAAAPGAAPPAESAPFPCGSPPPSHSAPGAGYVRIRTPAARVAQFSGRRSAAAASVSNRPSARPLMCWSMFPGRDSQGRMASAATPSPDRALAEPAATVDTATVSPLAMRPEALQGIRLSANDRPQSFSGTAFMLPVQRPLVPPQVTLADAHSAAGAQGSIQALEKPGQAELLAALHRVGPVPGEDWPEVADALAELLDQEADMRGLER